MTSKLTRERLQEIAEDGFLKHGESKELARMALAAMDSEPVAYTDERNLGYIDRGRETAYLWGKQNSESSDVALYRHAQPAPVVPDKMTYQDGVLFVLNNDMSSIERGTVAMRAWNACRAAMLQAGNSPVIPEGYVMVPKEPTERMVIDGFESEPDETFSEPEVWEAFQKMSGCEQAAFRARLCWAAMLAAAPQEVKGE